MSDATEPEYPAECFVDFEQFATLASRERGTRIKALRLGYPLTRRARRWISTFG